MDPAHIAPSRSDANSNGHFPLNNHGQAGTPRGFNLANAPFSVMGAGNAPNAIQVAQFMAQNGMNAQWGMPGMMDSEGGGPRRTGAGRYGNRMPGPYDRNGGKGQRDARWNSSGRLSPVRGKPVLNPRFSDSAGAGPREAIQGRALKSYEDLDAAGTGDGTAALDY